MHIVMKAKFILCLLFLISCLFSFSQKHMKFMGIPIDGNVYSFCEKLKAKGFVKNEEGNNIISYMGTFYGESAYIDVTYDPSNKNVYQVSASIIKQYPISLYSIQRDIMKAIEDKYKYRKEVKDVSISSYDYYIFDEFEPVGMIQTYILDMSKLQRTGESMLSISYLDVENYMKFEEKKRGDI